jgi:hypothetical protein
MAKQKSDPLTEALIDNQSYTITMADGGDFASMRAVLKHGQTLTFSPVNDYREVQANDIVIVKWRGGNHMMHIVGEIKGDQFLIVNSLGKVNGWVQGDDILGRVTESIEPEPRPDVPDMLIQLENAYQKLNGHEKQVEVDAQRLYSIAEDMRWYAAVLGPERWDRLPQLNRWSFVQHLWHLTKQAEAVANSEAYQSVHHLIHHGKEHVGQIAEAFSLYEQESQ